VTPPSPRSLALDLFSTLRGESMPVGALVAAAGLFEIPENAMRVAVTRMLAAGELARDERGRYRLGPSAAALNEHVTSWRGLEEKLCRWEGGWVAVQRTGLARGRGERTLRLLGFAPFSRELALRPDNLRGGTPGLRAELAALGLPAGTSVFALRDFDAETEARARSLWDVAALRAAYARHRLALARSEARLARAAEPAAMVESFRLGGRVIRELVRDPLLPEELLPGAERRALVAAMCRYDRAGRRIWAAFMARHGAPHAALPADGLAVAARA
jgi:phenylacetic acid degradation operon negative regulatory protein